MTSQDHLQDAKAIRLELDSLHEASVRQLLATQDLNLRYRELQAQVAEISADRSSELRGYESLHLAIKTLRDDFFSRSRDDMQLESLIARCRAEMKFDDVGLRLSKKIEEEMSRNYFPTSEFEPFWPSIEDTTTRRSRKGTGDTQVSQRSRAVSEEVAADALIAASARNEDAPNEYENRVKESRAGGVELKRMVAYLPSRIAKQSSGSSSLNVSFFGASLKLVTGGFLTLTEDDTDKYDGVKQNVFDENVNLAVISALLLTLVMPMFFDSWEDYLGNSSDRSGTLFLASYIGSRLDAETFETVARILADTGHCAYVLSSTGFLFSTLSSVYILLCVNEIGSDNGVRDFLHRMGRTVRIPYIFFSIGMVCFLGIAARCVFTARSLEALIIEWVLLVPAIFVFVLLSQIYCVQCTCQALHEIQYYEPLALTPAEARADVELYLQNAGPSAEISDCLFVLQARTPTGAIVSLSSVTSALVKAAYHRKMVELLGLQVPDAAIYQITRDFSGQTFL